MLSFEGLDPVAVPPPGFDCQKEGLCARSARTEAAGLYRVQAAGGISGSLTVQAEAANFDLGRPTGFRLLPGFSPVQPGPLDPGPWWPAAIGSLGGSEQPFRLFVAEVAERCGNRVIEGDEECDGTNLAGLRCEDVGFGAGTLICSQDCKLRTAACSLPGCVTGVRGDPGCDCRRLDDCDPLVEECAPDGPGSFGLASVSDEFLVGGLYCFGDAVCGLGRFELDDGQPSFRSVCRDCTDPGEGVAYGCPCTSSSDCAASGQAGPPIFTKVPLACWGTEENGWAEGPGVCLPEIGLDAFLTPSSGVAADEFERTRWLCKTSCSSLARQTLQPYRCQFDDFGVRLRDAVCADADGCGGRLPGECEETGGRCDEGECARECDPANNTSEGNPECSFRWGYPSYYSCAAWRGAPRCAPPFCTLEPPFEIVTWCGQFLNGEP
jgi:hypothetical protein